MKAKLMISISISILTIILISGFGKNSKKNDSFGFVFIPMGSTSIDDKTYSLDSYWIAAHEVSNKEYNLFLNDLKTNGKIKELEIAKIHTNNWKNDTEYLKPYAEVYNSHPAYENYPVLNISHEAAKIYCEWLTSKTEDNTYKYRLPTKIEWVYAARGGLYPAVYSWGGFYLRNKKGETMCNYKKIGDELIHTTLDNYYEIKNNKKLSDHASIPTPVDSYWPNDYGLYNMCGNIAEMIDDKGIALGGSWNSTGYDVRIESELNYTKPNLYTGFRPVKVKVNN